VYSGRRAKREISTRGVLRGDCSGRYRDAVREHAEIDTSTDTVCVEVEDFVTEVWIDDEYLSVREPQNLLDVAIKLVFLAYIIVPLDLLFGYIQLQLRYCPLQKRL